jgi:hypothetical protein
LDGPLGLRGCGEGEGEDQEGGAHGGKCIVESGFSFRRRLGGAV